MKTSAAILVETGKPLEVADIELPPLKPGQVLVEVAWSGVCHTQLLEARGYRGHDAYLPHCLGHEGSGRVLEVGEGVRKCKADDAVILSWMKGSGSDVPGTVYKWDGRDVNAGGVTTFQRHAVVSENRITLLPTDVDFADAALLGCAVPTGMGAVRNTAQVEKGQRVAVFGTGGVGLCAVAAARISGAANVIAVDTNPARLEVARELGATETIIAADVDPVESIRNTFPQGIDVAIEASGRPAVMQQALRVVRSRGGTVVVVGNARHGERLEIDPGELNQGKRLLGTWGGDNDPDRDFPDYCNLLISGQLSVRPLRSKTYSLEQIDTALNDLEAGRVTRPLVAMSPDDLK